MTRLQRFLAFALIAIVGGVMFLAAFLAAGALHVQDFAQYWSAAHLVRQNPYSFRLAEEFEHSRGVFAYHPLALKNPPWTIPFILPLGLFSYRVAFALWDVFSVAVLTVCMHAIWKELRLPASSAPIVLPLLFGPTIILLILGQWTILLFLGISVFLIAAERRQDWIAGASLLLVLGKPHVALIFLIALALWIVHTRRWTIALSGFLAVLTASLFVEVINPHIFTQFWARTIQVISETEPYPNLGGMLFLVSGVHALALIPQIAGLIWLVFYWKRHRRDWSWWEQGTVVILCSIICSYYSYPYDEILALPALLIAYANGNRRLFLVLFTLANLGYVLYISGIAGRFGFGYMFLWWTASGWVITYMVSQRRTINLVPAHETSAEPERYSKAHKNPHLQNNS